jgi:outer membrane protein assembly factor BamE (lipoprotein component of BamABCDE complex)
MLKRFLIAAAICLLSVGACAPITSYQGFQAVEANPKDVKVGTDTKTSVTERLGSPSVVATFDPNTWFYMTQVSDQVAFKRPVVRRRDIVMIQFAKDTDHKVEAVNTYTLKDGRIISINGNRTPTRGRELSVLEQILGNVGRSTLTPKEDLSPGDRPGG